MRNLQQLRNWRSTLAGVAMILSAIAHTRALADFFRPDVYGPIAGGIGLILCADARKDQTDARPEK